MKAFYRTIFIAALFLLLTTQAMAQKEPGTIGITASIQNNQYNYILPYWVDTNLIVAPTFALLKASDISLDIEAGIIAKAFIKQTENWGQYIGVKAAILYFDPENRSTQKDFLGGLAYGAEYFFHDKVSLGAELQFNATISDKTSHRFSNPNGVNFNTATAIYISFYFK